MIDPNEIIVSSSARSLYGKLLAIAPGFASFPQGLELYRHAGDDVSLSVIGRRDFFRRIAITRLDDDAFGDLVRAPYIEFVVRVDLQCAHIAQYENPNLIDSTFQSVRQPWERSDRLTEAFVKSFLIDLGTGAKPFARRCSSVIRRGGNPT